MGYDLGLADRLRSRGLKVIEVDGWRSRGSAKFEPRSSVNHHTAGARKGNAPSLGICVNGRADLPGPLCHVLLARDLTAFVIASGRANHAGRGGYQGLTGNSSVYGLEIENVGTSAEPWTAEQHETAAQIHAAFLEAVPAHRRALPCQHYEWTTRKIDAHDWPGHQLRARVHTLLTAPPTPEPEPEPEETDVWNLKQCIPERENELPESWRGGRLWACNAGWRKWVPSEPHRKILVHDGQLKDGPAELVSPSYLKELEAVGPLDDAPGTGYGPAGAFRINA